MNHIEKTAFYAHLVRPVPSVTVPTMPKEAGLGMLRLHRSLELIKRGEMAPEELEAQAMVDPNIQQALDFEQAVNENAALRQTAGQLQQQNSMMQQQMQQQEQALMMAQQQAEAQTMELQQQAAGRQMAVEQAITAKDESLRAIVEQQQHREQIMGAADQLAMQLKQVASKSPTEQAAEIQQQQMQMAAQQAAEAGAAQPAGKKKTQKEIQEAQNAQQEAALQTQQAQAQMMQDPAAQGAPGPVPGGPPPGAAGAGAPVDPNVGAPAPMMAADPMAQGAPPEAGMVAQASAGSSKSLIEKLGGRVRVGDEMNVRTDSEDLPRGYRMQPRTLVRDTFGGDTRHLDAEKGLEEKERQRRNSERFGVPLTAAAGGVLGGVAGASSVLPVEFDADGGMGLNRAASMADDIARTEGLRGFDRFSAAMGGDGDLLEKLKSNWDDVDSIPRGYLADEFADVGGKVPDLVTSGRKKMRSGVGRGLLGAGIGAAALGGASLGLSRLSGMWDKSRAEKEAFKEQRRLAAILEKRDKKRERQAQQESLRPFDGALAKESGVIKLPGGRKTIAMVPQDYGLTREMAEKAFSVTPREGLAMLGVTAGATGLGAGAGAGINAAKAHGKGEDISAEDLKSGAWSGAKAGFAAGGLLSPLVPLRRLRKDPELWEGVKRFVTGKPLPEVQKELEEFARERARANA